MASRHKLRFPVFEEIKFIPPSRGRISQSTSSIFLHAPIPIDDFGLIFVHVAFILCPLAPPPEFDEFFPIILLKPTAS